VLSSTGILSYSCETGLTMTELEAKFEKNELSMMGWMRVNTERKEEKFRDRRITGIGNCQLGMYNGMKNGL